MDLSVVCSSFSIFVLMVTTVSVVLMVTTVTTACNLDETAFTCRRKSSGSTTEICYGGSTGLTEEDALCMQDNSCQEKYKVDACGMCVRNGNKESSQYMDCTLKCYGADEVGDMKQEDQCGVCGGNGETCNPTVTVANLKLAAVGSPTTFDIAGTGFSYGSIEIVILNGNKVVVTVATKTNVKSGTLMTITVPLIEPGEYEIGARNGPSGTEYIQHTGPTLIMYDPADYSITDITPSEATLDGTSSVSVVLSLTELSAPVSMNDIYTTQNAMHCYAAESDVTLISDATLIGAGTYTQSSATLTCSLAYPSLSKDTWVCASFDQERLFDCRQFIFYAVAPTLAQNKAVLISDDRVTVTFANAVKSDLSKTCEDYFKDSSSFGLEPGCWVDPEDATILTIGLGDSYSLEPDDQLVLLGGLEADGAEFSRVSENVTLTVDIGAQRPIEIAVRGVWPTLITSAATNAITIEIDVLYKPANRQPESIEWVVNEIEQVEFANSLELTLDLSVPGNIQITVKVIDLFGGMASIVHTITKLDIPLPTVYLVPAGARYVPSGEIQIHPRSFYGIGTSIQYTKVGDSGLELYNFQWKKNDTDITGLYKHIAEKSEITIEMCSYNVIYSVEVSEKSAPDSSVEYSITFRVVCRNPVAHITGSSAVAVNVGSSTKVVINGELSYDPDGGTEFRYQWTCLSKGTDCIGKLGLTGKTSGPTLEVQPSKMTGATWYGFTLEVTIEKSDGNYSAKDYVNYWAEVSEAPPVRIVTIRNYFRHDVPIMIKVFVGEEVEVRVQWAFLAQAGYRWLDADDPLIGTKSHITEDGFAWFTIKPNVTRPGRKYKVEVNVTNIATGAFSTLKHDVFIYDILRSCTLKAKPITELTETSLALRDCLYDTQVKWVDAACSLAGKKLPINTDLTFIVPYFTDRSTTTATFECMVRDSLRHELFIASNEVSVTLSSVSRAERELDIIRNLELIEQPLEALEMLAGSEVQNNNEINAVELIGDLMSTDLNNDVRRRILISALHLNVKHMTTNDQLKLLWMLNRLLLYLCQNDDTSIAALSNHEIQAVIEKARELTEENSGRMSDYRKVEDYAACIKIRRMRNEDFDIIQSTSNHAGQDQRVYVVNALDDLEDFGVDVTFPEDLRSKYRDQWECGKSQVCHGIGIKVEAYDIEPPDLQFKRTDTDCQIYTFVDLYNQLSGNKLPIHDLKGTIDIRMSDNNCPRAKCWYYNEVIERFVSDGVATSEENGTVTCHSTHLSGFSLRSEPVLFDGASSLKRRTMRIRIRFNYPYAVCMSLGIPLIIISVIMLIKAFYSTRDRANFIANDKQPRDEDDDDDAYDMEMKGVKKY